MRGSEGHSQVLAWAWSRSSTVLGPYLTISVLRPSPEVGFVRVAIGMLWGVYRTFLSFIWPR